LTNNNVYGGFSQALFFSGSVSIPSLLLDYYTDLGIADREMMFIIHIIFEVSRLQTEDLDVQIMRKMGITSTELKSLVQSLKNKGFLAINTKSQKNGNNLIYDFSGLIDQLFELWGISQYRLMEALEQGVNENNHCADVDTASAKLISLFEKELGRPLTGFECEHIEKWLFSGNSEDLVIEALRRGVSAGIRNFRYLDSILREWEKKGIRTLQEVEAEDQHFQSRQSKKGEKEAKPFASGKNKYDNIYL